MKSGKRKVLAGLLAVVAFQLSALLAVYEWQDAGAQEAAPADGSGGATTMVAATGACGIGDEVSVLYVIDTEKKQLAVYYSNGGKDVRFVGARKIFYDLELWYYNDETPGTHSVKKLKELYEKSKDTGRSDTGTRRRRS